MIEVKGQEIVNRPATIGVKGVKGLRGDFRFPKSAFEGLKAKKQRNPLASVALKGFKGKGGSPKGKRRGTMNDYRIIYLPLNPLTSLTLYIQI